MEPVIEKQGTVNDVQLQSAMKARTRYGGEARREIAARPAEVREISFADGYQKGSETGKTMQGEGHSVGLLPQLFKLSEPFALGAGNSSNHARRATRPFPVE
jgi:hypothetical protein